MANVFSHYYHGSKGKNMVVKEKTFPGLAGILRGFTLWWVVKEKHGLYGSKENKHWPRHVFLLVVSK